jgi:FtsZ-binding cell division protein ZapB
MEAKLATNDAELQETHEKVSRVRHEQQLLQQQVADLNARAQQIKASHIEALQVAMRDPAAWSELRLIVIIR